MGEEVYQNRKYLDELYKKFGDFHACFYVGRKWELYSSIKDKTVFLPINHREIFPQEVIFDFDVKDNKRLIYYYEKIKRKLKRHNIAFKAYHTGGKGIHIHILYNELLDYSYEDRTIIKRKIIDYFFSDATGRSFSQYAKVDYQLCSRHLVRAEYGKHEKTGRHKTLIFEYTPLIKKDNSIPEKVLNEFKKEKEKPSPKTNILVGRGYLGVNFPCISFLLSQDFTGCEDGRKRALRSLCSYFYINLGDKGLDQIKEWNEYKLNGYFTEKKIENAWNSIKNMIKKGRRFGCRSMKDLLIDIYNKNEVCAKCLMNNQS